MPQPTDIPSGAEFGAWRSEIAQMKDTDGTPLWKGNTLNDALGTTVNGRNWRQLKDALNEYMNNAPVE